MPTRYFYIRFKPAAIISLPLKSFLFGKAASLLLLAAATVTDLAVGQRIHLIA